MEETLTNEWRSAWIRGSRMASGPTSPGQVLDACPPTLPSGLRREMEDIRQMISEIWNGLERLTNALRPVSISFEPEPQKAVPHTDTGEVPPSELEQSAAVIRLSLAEIQDRIFSLTERLRI